MGHTLGKTELNYQRVLKKSIDKYTDVAEKLNSFKLRLIRENTEPTYSDRVDSVKVMCPK